MKNWSLRETKNKAIVGFFFELTGKNKVNYFKKMVNYFKKMA